MELFLSVQLDFTIRKKKIKKKGLTEGKEGDNICKLIHSGSLKTKQC